MTGKTRPATGYVCIRGRDDLDPSTERTASGERLIVNPNLGKSVSAIPENIGVCEVVDVGNLVDTVSKGDVVFIDFFDVAQGYIVEGTEHYICPAHALRVSLDAAGVPHPLPGYVLTKHSPTRMTVAVTGCDRVIMPRSMTTQGIVSARDDDGEPDAWTVYEEVVEVADGDMQVDPEQLRNEWHERRMLRMRIAQLERALARVAPGSETLRPYSAVGYEPGDLVCFCTAFSIPFRANGEQYRVTPKRNVLATIDDAAILEEYNRTNPPPPLVKLVGAGGSLYGV